MFTLVSRDMTDCGEDIGGMSGGALNAISMINASFTRFVVDIKVLQVIVEID